MPNYGNKIGNQIKRHAKIADSKAKQYFGGDRSARVCQNSSVNDELAFKRACDFFAFLPRAYMRAC